ncbi:hypothetical protein [Porphyrobacter sp. CACIAM 03H1]|uniref:hypothetical protein n=1 Tax=Porphyrobacter sp. CACIAM 03H1 TaxID=2003315 RepID=UPI000B5ABB5C|nr:hypothetical protein [Porphyrobacter sp. CACIAM 03H1]ASJ91207.1 hypothetical protein CBR61_09975 [Porphyrobacter sp. CACIAM 03H1]
MTTAARALAFALPALCLTLAACGSEPAQSGNDAESFAARIGAGEATPVATPAPAATATPQIAEPLPGAAPGPFARGTLTDPASRTCGAPLMGPFIGKLADQATRAEIARLLGRTDNLRFVAYGSGGFVNPDPTNPRLSIMLDAQNIIRDARCG